MNIYIIIGIIFALQAVFLIIYLISKKKKDAQKQNENYDRLLPVYNDPSTVKVALWINIEQVNGEPLDEDFVYQTKLKNGLLNPNGVEVALFAPGSYQFIVSSNSRTEYQNIAVQVELLPGMTYQLGCDNSGPYLVEDPNPARYALRKAE